MLVPVIWLATDMHRRHVLIPPLMGMGIQQGAFRALGRYLSHLGLRTPALLSE